MEVEIYKMTFKKRNNANELIILGEEFVKNNMNKGFLIIDNKKKKLNSKYDISNVNFSQKKIKLVLNRNIYNKSCMLKNCESLESFIPFSIEEEINSEDQDENRDKENIEEDELNESFQSDSDEHPMYKNIKIKFSDFSIISQQNEDINSSSTILYFGNELKLMNSNNYTIIKEMFSDCKSLLSLPDISEWKTDNVTDMSYMFNNCGSLPSLPDISKWKTDNVMDMSYMFNNCGSLLSLPDISKWKTDNVTDMSYMFNNCRKLSSLPDISKWNTKNVSFAIV